VKSSDPNRRRLLVRAGTLALASLAMPVLAQGLIQTPRQTRGPFYPPTPPLEQDADLIRVGNGTKLAEGEITHLSGRVFDAAGKSLPGVRVEIWQCDAHGRYHHPDDRSSAPLDPNFQGFGAAATDESGSYAFRTIKPVPYPGRTPHIHFRVAGPNMPEFVTQMYVAGHPGNESDGVLAGIRDPKVRGAVLVPFRAIKGEAGRTEWAARFDIVLGINATRA
jgi:protocatechuate 3,4-dioxygenase beta subunit